MDLINSRLSVNQALSLTEFKRENFGDLLSVFVECCPHPSPQHFCCKFRGKRIFRNDPFRVNQIVFFKQLKLIVGCLDFVVTARELTTDNHFSINREQRLHDTDTSPEIN